LLRRRRPIWLLGEKKHAGWTKLKLELKEKQIGKRVMSGEKSAYRKKRGERDGGKALA